MHRAIWALLFLAALAVVLPQVVVPLALPPGTVRTPVAASLGEPTAWPYAFGALVCHQRPDRSFSLAGNQLPVCERCLAIELGMAAAFAAAVLVAPRGGFVTALSVFLPERLRSTAGVLAVGLVLMLPLALDGGLQLATAYVSATPQRVVTGFLYGIGQAGIVIGAAAWLLTRQSESLMPSRRR
jgi:uncharacterized membrane protein